MRGLIDRLDYLEGLGVTAIWMAPMFKNRPVQGTGADASAGYHGYWITDFTQVDPHFGTNAELRAAGRRRARARDQGLLRRDHEPHRRRHRVRRGHLRLRVARPTSRTGTPTGSSSTTPTTPARTTSRQLNLQRFPYTPVFPTAADATVKVPAWLNDRTMYHNRGNSTFAGENALYGDFFGLDDLFTERPEVVQGMIDIYSAWVADVGIDGYRIDTVKHVNDRVLAAVAPALVQHAASDGDRRLLHVRRGLRPESRLHVALHRRTRSSRPCSTSPSRAGPAPSRPASSTTGLAALFADDDYYTDADSNAYSLPTFLGNHDMGRIGNFLRTDNAGATDAELLARDELAHALMYLTRGQPVVYYGDEQGFTGDGGDKDARQDMFPSQVASYNDDDLIGTDATTADSNFDPTHPLYQALADLAELRADHRPCARARRSIATRPTAPASTPSRGSTARRADRVRRRAQQHRDAAVGAGADVLERDGLHLDLRRRRGGDDGCLRPSAADGAGALGRRLPRGLGARRRARATRS